MRSRRGITDAAFASADPTVFHVVNSLDVGGTEKQLFLLLKHLGREGFQSKVLALSKGGYWVEPIRQLGIELIELERRGSYEVRRLLALARAIRQSRATIVHTWQPAANLYGAIAARLSGAVPLVVSYRSIDRHRGLRAAVERMTFRSAAAVVCNSRALAEDLQRRDLVRAAPAVVHNGIEHADLRDSDRASARLRLGLPEDAHVVVTVGRLVPFKNHALVVEIAAEVLSRCCDCFFLLVGEGPERSRLEALARRRGVASHVLFLGQRTDVQELLSISDIFLFPSCRMPGSDGVAGEGFPNAVMEAMQAAVPCVASSASGADELFADGEAGFLLDQNDKQGFVHALLELMANGPSRDALGAQGRDIITSRFGEAAMVRKMAEIYRSLLT